MKVPAQIFDIMCALPIEEEKAISPTALAEKVGIPQRQIYPQTQRMFVHGWITRHIYDDRSVEYTLTHLGIAARQYEEMRRREMEVEDVSGEETSSL